MSVPKSRRKKSSVDFEMVYLRLVDGIDELMAHDFFAEGLLADKNRTFLQIRCESLQRYTDDLLQYIKMANSIYPQCLAELDERRLAQDKAIGVCYAILTVLQRILMRLRVNSSSQWRQWIARSCGAVGCSRSGSTSGFRFQCRQCEQQRQCQQ